jgi:hypothetical protein
MELCLDRPERSTRLVSNLGEGELREVAEGDDLAIRLIQVRHGCPDEGSALGAKGELRGVGLGRAEGGENRSLPDDVSALRVVSLGVGRDRRGIDPGDRAPPGRLADRDSNADPGEPRAERPVTPPGPKRTICGHERLLGSILGVVEITEDAITAPDERARLALHESPERVAIPGQDRRHDPTRLEVVSGRLAVAVIALRVDRMVSWVVAWCARNGRLA